ncbi:radical SAM superfamily protein [Oxobacter pfennigii]|uniref:Radical SAM superfamily protein n=1 Tax=Oxobacter pfennigii TaxID=36849 RepID=A0A0P8X1Y7_9CLOT|nr:radical SAM protein [Oxobacter pfennigii]KPU44822.1 radical SAM superfamily protein [Oxobacter pfennigii]
MKILLVRPPRVKQAVTLGEFMFCEPIGLEMVYAVLMDRHEIKILDMMIENTLEKELETFKPHVVGITSLCIDVNMVKSIACKVKEINSGIIVIAGGTQAFLNLSSFYDINIDHVFKYTTRDNLNLLFDALESKKELHLIDGIHSKVNQYRSTNVFGRNEYIIPNRLSTQKYRQHYSYLGYKPCAIMQTSLGCSSNCDFCLRWRIEGAKENDIDLECVMNQIKDIQEDSIMFYDNNFLNNRDRLEKFCDLIEQNNIVKNFICYGSVKSIISHPETIKRLGKCGLKAVLVGYETFSEKELADYKKKSTVEDNYKASKILKEAKIDCWASFMLHPDWDTKDFKNFRSFVKKLKPEITTFCPLTPFPNLPMYQKYKDRLLLRIEDYEMWSFSKVSIKPSKISLSRYYFEILKFILFVNLRLNSASYMINRFGFMTLIRITKGSIKILPLYIKLMLEVRKS